MRDGAREFKRSIGVWDIAEAPPRSDEWAMRRRTLIRPSLRDLGVLNGVVAFHHDGKDRGAVLASGFGDHQ
jgi:hypothetical protein